MFTILITASGGDLAQAVCKALKLSPEPMDIIGADADDQPISRLFFPSFVKIPLARDSDYLDALERICLEKKIDAVIPCSEAEINVLSSYGGGRNLRQSSAKVICLHQAFHAICSDKLTLYQALDGKVDLAPFCDLSVPAPEIEKFVERNGFPFVAKERRSSGSKGVYVVNDWDELLRAKEKLHLGVLQKFISDEDGEYSIAVYAPRLASQLQCIAFRRKLGPVGASWSAEVVHDKDVEAYALAVCEQFELEGSVNIQLRKNRHGCSLLEINPRFSSLVSFRAICGFQDVWWSLEEWVYQRAPTFEVKPYPPYKFQRFFGESVDKGSGYQSEPKWIQGQP